MSGGLDIGRLPDPNTTQPPVFDAPNAAVKAINSKLDQVIDKLNLILDAIETGTDGDSLFTALDVAATKAALTKIKFTL